MIITRNKIVKIVAPFAVAGALVFTGCTVSVPAASTPESASSTVESEAEAEESDGVFEVLTEDSIMTGNTELDAQLAEFSAKLKASAAEGISHIMITAYSTDTVGIQVWTDDEAGVVSGEQLKPVLDAIASFTPAVPIGEFEIDGWDFEGMQGETNGAAAELGVRAEFIDDSWWNVVIPGDQVANIFV